ncbi:MAG: polyprenyl synthetase family protein [Dehalococcoidia bacterium]
MPIDDLPTPLMEHQTTVENALRRHMDKAAASGLPLYRMMQYQLGWRDKDGLDEVLSVSTAPRVLGALCLETAMSWGQGRDQEPFGLAAAAVELLRESVTVHEDMQSAEPHTQGRDAVWWVWGPAQAINVGDGLHALARLAVFNLLESGLSGDDVLAVVGDLDAAALRYYEGQYLELTFQERIDITVDQYAQMARAKRGALFGGALAAGARVAGASPEAVGAFRAAGEHLGLASQIAEDIALIWTEERESMKTGRLLNKSKLYPVVHALETGPVSRKRALGEIYFKRVMEPSDIEALRAILDEAGVRGQALDRAQSDAEMAIAMLEEVGLEPAAIARWREVAASLLSGPSD